MEKNLNDLKLNEKYETPLILPNDNQAILELLNRDIGNPSDTRDNQRGTYNWFKSQGNGKWPEKWPLHQAAMHGDLLKIHYLVKNKDINPNEKMTDWFDSEPLGWAASLGNFQAVIELIKLGADPLRPANKAGNTPLKDAQREKHTRIINFLKEYEKLKHEDKRKKNKEKNKDNYKIIESEGNLIEDIEYKREQAISELLNRDIGNPSDTRENQRHAYNWFKSQGNGKWPEKWPLHQAAMHGDLLRIHSLVNDKGIDPNEKMTDWYDSEPLGWAASFGNLQAVIELIKLGADPLRPANKAGNTPLKDAQRERYSKVIKFLKEYEKLKRGSNGGNNKCCVIF